MTKRTEIKFVQIAATSYETATEYALFGLTKQGRVFRYYDGLQGKHGWYPLQNEVGK